VARSAGWEAAEHDIEAVHDLSPIDKSMTIGTAIQEEKELPT